MISKLLRAKSSAAVSSKLDLDTCRCVAVRMKYVITKPVRSTTNASTITRATPLRHDEADQREVTLF
jgi:hypothetical protein